MRVVKLSMIGATGSGIRYGAQRDGTVMRFRFHPRESMASAAVRRRAAAGYVSGRSAGILRLLDDSFSLQRIHVQSVPD